MTDEMPNEWYGLYTAEADAVYEHLTLDCDIEGGLPQHEVGIFTGIQKLDDAPSVRLYLEVQHTVEYSRMVIVLD